MAHFAAWVAMIAAALGIAYAVCRTAIRGMTMTRFSVAVGPLLPAVFWIYGMAFNWGNAGRFGQYARLRSHYDYEKVLAGNPLLMVGLVVGLAVLLVMGWRLSRAQSKVADNSLIALLTLLLWALSGYCLSRIPFAFLDWWSGNDGLSFYQWVTWSPDSLAGFLIAAIVGVSSAATAAGITHHELAVAGLSPVERSGAWQAWSRGMLPGAGMMAAGTLLNFIFARASIFVPIASLVLIVVGAGVAVMGGHGRRRDAIAEILSARPR